LARLSNDNAELVPRTAFDGPELRFDFPGLEIGVAEYDEGPTGCTVFSLQDGAAASIDVRGGSPGVTGAGYDLVHAICLAGGSAYGLEATAGVAAELFARREYRTGWLDIPLVAGAIVFDWGRRDNAIYPDKELGRAALRAARRGIFPLGARGAGRSATAGKIFAYEEGEPAGQGAAFRQVGETRLAVFTVVNAIGAIVDRDGNVVRGHYDAKTTCGDSWCPAWRSGSPADGRFGHRRGTPRSRSWRRTFGSIRGSCERSVVRCTRRWRARFSPSTRWRTATCSSP
jgi:6-aminohexanoate-oligomer endohydrolase